MTFTLAIVGRPNVGKSTLFNRLTGRKRALVDDQPGVTRDRREGEGNIAGLLFRVLDTAGLEQAEKGSLQARMTNFSEQAIEEADVSLMVVDGRAGITPTDEHFAKLIRRKGKPTILAVNKVEGKQGRDTIAEAHRLGLGEPIAISAEQGEGLGELLEALLPFAGGVLPEEPEEEVEEDEVEIPMQIALVGRPNVGKSTLFNRILGYERTLTGPEAGITRDSIMVDCEFGGQKLKLVDTAGMRKRANVTDKVEKMATSDTLESIRYAHVVVWVIDAQQPLENQDNHIAAHVEEEGRAMVLAVNKWDLIEDQAAYLKAIEKRLASVLHQASGITVVPISAQRGMNVEKLLKACFHTYKLWNKKLGTGELNRWLEMTLEGHSPPLVSGRRIKIRYMTQKTARPPTFLLFSNTDDIPEHYLRYMVKSMREYFNLPGVPIRIKIRKNKNPYKNKKADS
ncbi:MAG: ribosome biogenesis GTPase Der [Rickettsiales bacterium]|nr:ribosome biogenesis GTPase Der [Rickettsiales bacterium]